MELTISQFQGVLGRRVRKFGRELVKNTTLSLLDETTRNPGPPVDTGRLMASGTAYLGSRMIASNGQPPQPKTYDLPDEPEYGTIVYSTPKHAGDNANVYFVFAGTKWFDYATYHHRNHATHSFWVRNVTMGSKILSILERSKMKAIVSLK